MGADTARFALISRLVFVIAACGACAARSGPNEFPELVEHEGKEIEEVRFEGAESFSLDTLRTLVETKASRCSLLGLPVCVPFTNFGQQEHHLDPGRVTGDARRLELFYRSEGYFGTVVTPRAEPYAEDVIVTFDIERGDPVILDSLAVSGTEGVLDPDSLLRAMSLQADGIFDLRRFGAAADTVLRALQARGHVYAVVLRNFTVDTLRDRATASLDAIPGPQVTVDSIVVTGAEHMGRAAAVRQLTVREGDLLRQSDLVESQRNLYALELVRFANVTLAADSMRRAPEDSSKATVLVSIAEAPVYQVDAAIGFGTVECFRAETTWEDRSFGSGARQLTLTGSLSKIGIATGLSNALCNEYEGDEFAGKLDYRAAADLVQPYFLSPRNNLNLNLFVERQSQPRIFQREAVGGQFGFSRRLAARTVLTG
ncbi:MAG: POTRA domain-containing protein, partial [Longimicrobiales bacterium]